MNTKQLPAGITVALALLAFTAVADVRAQSSDEALAAIQFPIIELGNCGSKAECKTYCDDPENMEACIAFAERHSLMPTDEVAKAKKFIAAGKKGPGGCTGKDSCEAYCNDIANIDACVAFAEENDLMPPEELEEAKKVQAAIKRGIQPPPCESKDSCDEYCESPENMPTCIAFAREAGLMSPEEQADADKMLAAIQSGAKPPACRGKRECDAYCSQDEHFDECVEFGKAAGFMSSEEYEMAKKTRGKGPGGCRGKEECDAFCTSSPENEDICFNFGKENGLIPPEQLQQMEEGNQRFRESFSNMPPEVVSCLTEKWGAENFEKLQSGTMRPNRQMGEAMQPCFQQFEEQRMQNERQQQQMMQRPEGESSCEGENCGPPEGMMGQGGPESGDRSGPPPGYECEGDGCQPPEGYGGPPPEGYGPPPGASPAPDGSAFGNRPPTAEELQQYQQQYQQQYEQQYQQQVQQIQEQMQQQTPPAPAVSAESFGAAAILFLKSLLRL